LRDEGPVGAKFVRALFEAPLGWRREIQPVAIRGHRLALTRERYRDTDEADRPITAETYALTEVADDELVCHTAVFDVNDIDAAMSELTVRWIVSGEAAHPDIIEAVDRLNE
jgi:hypothetical protein